MRISAAPSGQKPSTMRGHGGVAGVRGEAFGKTHETAHAPSPGTESWVEGLLGGCDAVRVVEQISPTGRMAAGGTRLIVPPPSFSDGRPRPLRADYSSPGMPPLLQPPPQLGARLDPASHRQHRSRSTQHTSLIMKPMLLLAGFVALISIFARTKPDVVRTIPPAPTPIPNFVAPRVSQIPVTSLQTSGRLGETKRIHQNSK